MTINLTFIGPCIVIYFYSKINQMHQGIKFILFGIAPYMFRTVFPPIVRRLYQTDTECLLASKQSAIFV